MTTPSLPKRAAAFLALAIAGLTAPTPRALAQVAFDSSSSATAAKKAASVSWTHTVGSGANTVLIVGLSTQDTTAADLVVSSITFNGVAMTAVPKSIATVTDGSTINQTELFYLLAPAAGAHSIAVTFAAGIDGVSAGSTSLSGVAQVAPSAVAVNTDASGSTISTSLSVATAGSWLVDVVCNNTHSGSFTAGSAQTKRYDIVSTVSDGAGSTERVAAVGTATASWTASSSGREAQSVAAFAPASGTAATAPSITTQPSSLAVTAGSSASFSVAAGGTAPLAYQWKFGSSSISGATSSTYTIASAQSANAGSYTVTVSNSAGSATSSAATLTVNAAATAPSITTQPSSLAVTAGSSASFSVAAGGTGPLAYQWKFGSSSISGATSSTYTIASAQSANAGSYTVTVSNSAGSATSSAATLTVNAAATAPSITTQPSSLAVTAGSSASFSVAAGGTGPLAYQWKFGSSSISGATSSTYTIASAQSANAGSYTVTVSNSAGSATSSAATLTVNAAATASAAALITTQPLNQAVAAGGTISLSVAATGTAPISYQWYLDGTTAIAGATGASYTITDAQATNAGAYDVVVSNSAGSDRSTLATVTTLPIIPAGVFNITSYGASTSATDNSAAITAAIAAATAVGGGTVEIPSGTFMSEPISLASNINLQLDKGALLQAQTPANYGSSGSTVLNFISLNGLHDVEISGQGTIDGNGSNWWGSGGTRPKLIHLSDCTTVYVRNTDPSVNSTSAPTAGLTFSNSMKEHFICDGNTYPAGLPGGGVDNVTVDGVIISAPGSSPNTDGIDPCGNHWIIENSSLSEGDDNVAVKAETASCYDISVNNVWVGTGHGLSIGAQTNYGVDQFRVTNCSFNGTDYVVRLKDEAGEGGPVSNVLYQNVTFTNIIKAVIYVSSYYDSLPSNPDTAPTSTTLMPTWQNITLRNFSGSVTKLEKGLGDIWGIPGYEIDGVVLDNVSITDAQTKDALTINNARHVSYVNGTALPLTTGTDALYNVDPVITTQPASQTASPGSAVTFTVAAASAGTETYQWYKNGTAISGATSASLTLSSVQTADAGSYSATVTNATGSNPSDDAILTVN